VPVPVGRYNRSAQHLSAISADQLSDGIEVGWFVGWDPQTGSFDTYAHPYFTENGPHEIDGPLLGQATDWYSTNWNGDTQEWVIRASHGGTAIWPPSSQATDLYSGPGTLVGLGEVVGAATFMEGTFSGDSGPLELFDGSAWHNWPSINLCADAGYSSSGTVDNFTDTTN
jgi:hypothetical protein